MVARPAARAVPELPRARSKQQSKRNQFIVKYMDQKTLRFMVRYKNRSIMLAAQAAFCGRQDLPHFAAVTGMSNRAYSMAASRIHQPTANSPAPQRGQRLEGWK